MKSQHDPADTRDMPFLASADSVVLSPLAFTAIIAAGVVLLALRVLATEMEFARRWHALREEAAVLRAKQLERLRNLQPRRR